MKTRQEIDKLKKEWLIEANYDLTQAEGYDEYIPELMAFQRMHELAHENEELHKKLRIAKEDALKAKGIIEAFRIFKELFSGIK